jgi:hypothetical protein
LLAALEHDTEADPELIASLQVYRNASLLIHHLATQEEMPNATSLESCNALIDQGTDLLDRSFGHQ